MVTCKFSKLQGSVRKLCMVQQTTNSNILVEVHKWDIPTNYFDNYIIYNETGIPPET